MVNLATCRSNGDFLGLSTDEKPATCEANTFYIELDTGNVYFFNGEEWKEFAGEANAPADAEGDV